MTSLYIQKPIQNRSDFKKKKTQNNATTVRKHRESASGTGLGEDFLAMTLKQR